MTLEELQQQRRARWRLGADPIRTIEDARDFIESAGFCLMYPQRPPLLCPTFVGACIGDDADLPAANKAFTDPRTQTASELMIRLLREKACYEANLFGENNFLLSNSVFPFFYALTSDKNPTKIQPKAGEVSFLAEDAFNTIKDKGPISKAKLRELLARGVSTAALDRALNELWSKLKITRVDYVEGEGAVWDTLQRWAPQAVKEGVQLSAAESVSALVSKYLESVVAAEQREIEDFFSHFVSRAKVKDSINILLAARAAEHIPVGSHTLIRMVPPRTTLKERSAERDQERARKQPIHRRTIGSKRG